jgi:hypothetical protein
MKIGFNFAFFENVRNYASEKELGTGSAGAGAVFSVQD